MIDVSLNLFNALPLYYQSGQNIPAGLSIQPLDETRAGANSLKQVARNLQPETALADFSPPAAGATGFASLGPALEALRIPPEKLSPTQTERDTSPSFLEQLRKQLETGTEPDSRTISQLTPQITPQQPVFGSREPLASSQTGLENQLNQKRLQQSLSRPSQPGTLLNTSA